MRISDWSSDVCSSDLAAAGGRHGRRSEPMSRKYFGTDGIRGRVGEGPISADFVLRLGNAYGHALRASARARGGEWRKPVVIIGKDKNGRASCRERVCQYV